MYCSSFSFRSSSTTGLGGGRTIAASSTATHTGRRWTLYHTAARPTVVVVGVGTSLNVTTGTTSKAIEENTKPTTVATITEVAVVVGGRWHCDRRRRRKQPTESTRISPLIVTICCSCTTGEWPPPPTQLMMVVVGATTGSVLSRVLHFAVQLTRSG